METIDTQQLNALYQRIETFASDTFTPIIKRQSLEILLAALRESGARTALEIGTAIGYSAIRMLEAMPQLRLTSLEIRHCRHAQAMDNIRSAGFSDRAELLLQSAEAYLPHCGRTFDFVFLDGPKGQYAKQFEMLLPCLGDRAVIFTDNLSFDGRVASARANGVESLPRKHRAAVRGIMTYIDRVTTDPRFETTLYVEGDGVAVTRRRQYT